MLTITNVKKTFNKGTVNEKKALNGINLHLAPGDFVTIIGGNGAGKSTLLDAIQFVIICSTGYFNKAAHENGKRRLTGYIRCKTGKENQPYERTGEISAHVALEFYEESKDKYFIIGAVVDSASEGQETTVRYLMENTRISDDLFLYGNQVKSIAEFRGSNIDIRQWCKTNVEARRMVTARLGRIEDKFFRLIPKALAFKPIDDIKDFVYSYVLDEKEVNIDVLRENVRTYQDMERTLDNVKKRMKKLKKIQELYQRVQERIEKDRMYEYFLKRSDLELVERQLSSLETARKNEEIRLSQAKAQLEMLQKERSEKQEIATNIRVELRQAGEGDVVKIDLNRPMPEILKELTKYPVATRLSLNGTIIVGRDIAHAKLKERLDRGEDLPQYIKDHPIYYAGPAKTPEGMACGSMGPTTAGRMDSYVELFQSHGGSMVMLAKGNRSQQVTDACQKYGGFYLGSIGGPAAILAQNNIKSIECVEYPELGMEAIWKIEVEDFPAFILVDDKGNDFFKQLKPWNCTK